MAGAKGVEITGLDIPESLQPGETATARIDATNGSSWISPWDEDRCAGGNAGLLIEGVLVGPRGESTTGTTVCAEQHDIVVSYEATSEVTFTAPEDPGTYQYEAYIRTAETGKTSSRVSAEVDVYGAGDDPPAETPDEGAGDWLDRIGDGSAGSASASDLEAVLAVVVVFGALYAAGNLFDIQLGGRGPGPI